MKAQAWLVPVAVCGCFVAVGWAALAPVQDAAAMFAGADVVVRGRVTGLEALGDSVQEVSGRFLTVHRSVARLQVEGVFKGLVSAPEIRVEVLAGEDCCLTNLADGEYALVFLKNPVGGIYVFSEPQNGKLPIRRGPPALEPASASGLERELIASLDDANPEVLRTAIQQLGRWKSRNAVPRLLALSDSTDPEIAVRAHASLLAIGEVSRIEQAARLVEAPGGGRILDAISDLRDSRLSPALVRLLDSPAARLRQSAAHALGYMQDSSAIPALIQSLDDSDADVRYEAVMALAAIDRSPARPAPARAVFDQNPQRQIAAWREWWRTEGRQRYPDRVH